MYQKKNRYLILLTTVLVALVCASTAWAGDDPTINITKLSAIYAPPKQWFIYGVIVVIFFSAFFTLLSIRAAMIDSSWSLTDALSEEVEITAMDKNNDPKLDDEGRPLMITTMRASISRLIALMGMIVILLMFLGFGVFALYSFADTGTIPADIDKVINFLMGGMTLFAPYVVNKFSSMFESFTPKRTH